MMYIELRVLCATRINYIGSIVLGTNQQVKRSFFIESPKRDVCILVNVEVTECSCFYKTVVRCQNKHCPAWRCG